MHRALLRGSLILCLWLLAFQTGAAASPAPFKPITLPADARMHADAPNEWWYFTGHLADNHGQHYGFELTTFRLSGLRHYDSFLPYDALYRIDLAITDEAHHTFTSVINYVP